MLFVSLKSNNPIKTNVKNHKCLQFPKFWSVQSPRKEWGPVLIKHLWSSRLRVDLQVKRDFFLRLAVPLKHQEILLQKAPLRFLSLESLWRQRTGGLKQGVCVWKHRSAIHFQLSWVQTARLWWDCSLHLISCAMLQIHPTAYLTAITLSAVQIWPICFSSHLNTLHSTLCSESNQALDPPHDIKAKTFTKIWKVT